MILQIPNNNILSPPNKNNAENTELGNQAKAGSLFADELKQYLGENINGDNIEAVIPEVALDKLAFEKSPISFDRKSKDSIEQISIEQTTLITLTPTNDGFESNLNPLKNNETTQTGDVTNIQPKPSSNILPTLQAGIVDQLNNIVAQDRRDESMENDIGDDKLKLEPIFNTGNSAISKETRKSLNLSSELMDKERKIIANLSVDDIKPKTDSVKYYVGFRSSIQPTLNADLVAKLTEDKPKEEFDEKTITKLAIDNQVRQAINTQKDQNIINYRLVSQPEQAIGREYVPDFAINGRQEAETAKDNNILLAFDQKIISPKNNTLPYNVTDNNLIKNEAKVEFSDEPDGSKTTVNQAVKIDNIEYPLFNQNNKTILVNYPQVNNENSASEKLGLISMNAKEQTSPSKIIFESNSQQNIERSSVDKMPTLNTPNIETFKELNISSISYIKSDAIQNNNEYKRLNRELISKEISESQQVINYEPTKTKTKPDVAGSQLEYGKLVNYQQDGQSLEKASQVQTVKLAGQENIFAIQGDTNKSIKAQDQPKTQENPIIQRNQKSIAEPTLERQKPDFEFMTNPMSNQQFEKVFDKPNINIQQSTFTPKQQGGNLGVLEKKIAEISTDQQITENTDMQDQSTDSGNEYSSFGKPSYEADGFNKNTQIIRTAEDISNFELGYEKAIFIKENGQKMEKESEIITTKPTNNEENKKSQQAATPEKVDSSPQKMEFDPIFSMPKAEYLTIQKSIEIKSNPLNLPKKITEYINMMKAYNDAKPHSVVIQLDPPNLGKIKLKVSMRDDKVIAEMNVANFVTKEIIEAQMPEIKRNLTQYDIQVSGFNVTLDNGNSKFSSQNPDSSQQNKWSTQSWLYDRNNKQKDGGDNKRRYLRYVNNDSLVDLLT